MHHILTVAWQFCYYISADETEISASISTSTANTNQFEQLSVHIINKIKATIKYMAEYTNTFANVQS